MCIWWESLYQLLFYFFKEEGLILNPESQRQKNDRILIIVQGIHIFDVTFDNWCFTLET